jgi:soluble lytic murein transglycosylase-like protein
MTESRKILQALTFGLMVAAQSVAAGPRLPVIGDDSGFTFRSVRPPASASARRIAFPADSVVKPAKGGQGWFWATVDPSRTAGDAARLGRVLAALGPDLARHAADAGADTAADRVLRDHGVALFRESKRNNVSPTLLLAVIGTESGGRVGAVSTKGALGLMQLMPATAKRFGVTDPMDPDQNIAGGAQYLSFLLDRFGGDAVLALAAYNAGEGAVDRHGGVPPYAETRAYVARTVAGFEALRGRCIAPPVAPRDPCAFDTTGAKG